MEKNQQKNADMGDDFFVLDNLLFVM